ncbi:MAG: DUF4381 family protein [Gammaproteobacteria bacterium]
MNPPDPATLPLRDIQLPSPVPWWPPAPGWWVLAGLVVVALALAVWAWRRHVARRLGRAALADIAAVEARFAADDDAHACARALSRLAHRMALVAAGPRAAASAGADWLAVLDSLGPAPLPEHLRPLLTRAPYAPAVAAAAPRDDYTALAAHLRAVARTLPARPAPERGVTAAASAAVAASVDPHKGAARLPPGAAALAPEPRVGTGAASAGIAGVGLGLQGMTAADTNAARTQPAGASAAATHATDTRSADISSADISSADTRSSDTRSSDARSSDISSANTRSAAPDKADTDAASTNEAGANAAGPADAGADTADPEVAAGVPTGADAAGRSPASTSMKDRRV